MMFVKGSGRRRKAVERALKHGGDGSTETSSTAAVAKPRPGVFLPMGPAKFSGLKVARPSALAFFHIEKTAGSAVMKWLSSPPPRWDRCG